MTGNRRGRWQGQLGIGGLCVLAAPYARLLHSLSQVRIMRPAELAALRGIAGARRPICLSERAMVGAWLCLAAKQPYLQAIRS